MNYQVLCTIWVFFLCLPPPLPRESCVEKHQHAFLCAFPYISGVVAVLESQGWSSPFFILVGCSMVFEYTKGSSCCLCSPPFPILRTFLLYFQQHRVCPSVRALSDFVITLNLKRLLLWELVRGSGDLECGVVLYGEKNDLWRSLPLRKLSPALCNS